MKPGDTVTWRYVPRGGWGYVFRTEAVILTLGKHWATIQVRKADGTPVQRRVKASNLEPRAESH